MVHGYILRTASGSLTTPERDLAEYEIEEINADEYNPNFRHRRSSWNGTTSTAPVEVAAVGRGGLTSHEAANMAAGSGPRPNRHAGEPRRGDVHRRLEFGTPEGALQAA
uniref:Uncharacterized protein n=1 Tax=Leersia perrieri TaxID=77586 RepID=A0A0D9WET7_9ORYZ